MTHIPILSQLGPGIQWLIAHRGPFSRPTRHLQRPNLHHLAQNIKALPRFVQESPVARRYLHLLGPLDWGHFPKRPSRTNWGAPTMPYAPFAAAYLVKLDQQLTYMSNLRHYLVDHPPLVWALGFPLVPSPYYPWGFDADASLPTQRHFARMMNRIPNAALQFLLDDTVRLIQLELPKNVGFGQTISLDTKHIIAWVKENNPKAYVQHRYDKTKQPPGDPDCRLGCKRRHNQAAPSQEPPTPLENPLPANTVSVGEYYWGYASGVVATKIPNWGEFVLAELTQPFHCADLSYFFPLMTDTERRLGFRPQFGAFDAAFDAFYVYEYFQRDGPGWTDGFAAVPLSNRGGPGRTFDEQGLPLCQAGLPMPLKGAFFSRKGLVPHEEGRYACPLFFPTPTGKPCPADHKKWAKGGCVTTLATSIGARIRHQLDRDSQLYQEVYKQRTATERVNSQAVELGIERPKLRNGRAIANQNTLIYVLINLRGLHRIRSRKRSSLYVAKE